MTNRFLYTVLSITSLAFGCTAANQQAPATEAPAAEAAPAEAAPADEGAAALPADDEAWTLIEAAAGLHDDSLDWKALWRAVRALEGPPTPEQQANWKRDEAALAKIDAALARPGLSIPVPESATAALPDWIVYQFIVRAMCLRGWDKATAGDLTAGAQDMVAAAQLGERFQDTNTYLLPTMVGIAIEGIAILELDRLFETIARDDRDAHLAAAQAFQGFSTPSQAVQRAWTAECTSIEALLRDLGTDPAKALGGGELPFTSPGSAEDFAGSYDADATVAWHQAYCDAMATAMAEPYVSRTAPAPEALWPAKGQADNPFGRQIMQEIYDSSPIGYLEREERLQAQQGGHALTWAARAYVLDNDGKLPATAEALVPDYLSQLPDDPFADGPIKLDGDRVSSAANGIENLAGAKTPAELEWVVFTPDSTETTEGSTDDSNK